MGRGGMRAPVLLVLPLAHYCSALNTEHTDYTLSSLRLYRCLLVGCCRSCAALAAQCAVPAQQLASGQPPASQRPATSHLPPLRDRGCLVGLLVGEVARAREIQKKTGAGASLGECYKPLFHLSEARGCGLPLHAPTIQILTRRCHLQIAARQPHIADAVALVAHGLRKGREEIADEDIRRCANVRDATRWRQQVGEVQRRDEVPGHPSTGAPTERDAGREQRRTLRSEQPGCMREGALAVALDVCGRHVQAVEARAQLSAHVTDHRGELGRRPQRPPERGIKVGLRARVVQAAHSMVHSIEPKERLPRPRLEPRAQLLGRRALRPRTKTPAQFRAGGLSCWPWALVHRGRLTVVGKGGVERVVVVQAVESRRPAAVLGRPKGRQHERAPQDASEHQGRAKCATLPVKLAVRCTAHAVAEPPTRPRAGAWKPPEPRLA
eukprot:scaffold332_cov105-Isochrysis_galbana.AAC.11